MVYFESECKLLDWIEDSQNGKHIQIGLSYRDHETIKIILNGEKTMLVHLAIVDQPTGEIVYADEGWIFKAGADVSPWLKIRVDDIEPFKGLEGHYFDAACKGVES